MFVTWGISAIAPEMRHIEFVIHDHIAHSDQKRVNCAILEAVWA